ncbi:MAG: insulinase family protein [Cyanosarcina radialis HA8281-LM2]|nr:insulinase family protein [Cyanosarcina radialis HA8281-LM2]
MQWLRSNKLRRIVRVGVMAIAAVLVLALLQIQLAATPAKARHYTELTFPPLPEIKLPEYTRFELDNGMVVYLLANRELPLVSGAAIIRTGDRFEPSDKVGLAAVLGAAMRTGGTKKHSGEELNQLLEQRAAEIETGIAATAGTAVFSSLTEDFSTVLGLFEEVLREPIFAPDKTELVKTQLRGAIARQNDEPEAIANREFQELIYGKDSPYARTPTYATVDRISRQEMQKFYQQYFSPNNVILGIAGDIDVPATRKLIEQKFGNWKPNPQGKIPPLPEASQKQSGDVFFVSQPQLTQSYITMGHLGGQLNSPDFPALDVLSGVLNGFGGRLFNEVRSRQGLAYDVRGSWSAQYDFPGVFVADAQTRSEATVPLIKSLFAEIDRLRNNAIAPAELAYAKDSVLNSFVFNFQDPSQTIARLMRYEYYDYPDDFIFRYQRGVEATTIKDVQRVAQKYLQPDKMVTLVVGNGDAIEPPLTSLGKKVVPVDISIPGSPS